jgi:NADH-quinone oxidoreductase subunit J
MFLYIIFIFFLLFSFFVILVRNPIISVFFLILVFFFSVLIFLFLGAEFLALLLLIVYVGAISILFLFVVMMLNLRVVELIDVFLNYLPIGGTIGFIFLFEMFYFMKLNYSFFIHSSYEIIFSYIDYVYIRSNLLVLSEVLFNYNVFFVIFAGVILFISMIGSIVLTLLSFKEDVVFYKNFDSNEKKFDNVNF